MVPVAVLPETAGTLSLLEWHDAEGNAQRVAWRSENGSAPPKRIVLADDQLAADVAYRLAAEGTGLLWTGDFQNARQLLQALARRLDRSGPGKSQTDAAFPQRFHLHRQRQAQRARILGMLIVPLEADYRIALRRAPDVVAACTQAYGPALPGQPKAWVSLREVQGLIGASEWRKKGVPVPALGLDVSGQPRHIHPYHGVFSPLRGEYLALVRDAVWPAAGNGQAPTQAFDIGAGTGVLSALLALRGVPRVVATDVNDKALACARFNLERLGLNGPVELLEQDMFPAGRAALVVCNPPWLPGKPSSLIEQGIYDPQSGMLRGFLAGLRDHLAEDGEGWLILSDFAEHLGLRSRDELLAWIAESGLRVAGRDDVRPVHAKSQDATDPLFAARQQEVTSLWRLVPA